MPFIQMGKPVFYIHLIRAALGKISCGGVTRSAVQFNCWPKVRQRDEARKPVAMVLRPAPLGFLGVSPFTVGYLGGPGADQIQRDGPDAYGLSYAKEPREIVSDCAGRAGRIVPGFMESRTDQLSPRRSYYKHGSTTCAFRLHPLLSARHNDAFLKEEPNEEEHGKHCALCPHAATARCCDSALYAEVPNQRNGRGTGNSGIVI